MRVTEKIASAALRGDDQILAQLSSGLIRVARDNLVERPWGGDWIRSFKQLPDDVAAGAMPWGEAFEISAFDDDPEARRFPSQILFDDDSRVTLPALLQAQGDALLGRRFVEHYGACFPLLPKTLDVKELLSVQGHPAGHTEVYVVIDAEPGASLRLGFNRDIDPGELAGVLRTGLRQQQELLANLVSGVDPEAVQHRVAPWLAAREADGSSLAPWIGEAFAANAGAAMSVLDALKTTYWRVLDSMNAIEAVPGRVIYNATPERWLAGAHARPSAEVHALGNPEGKEILALEIRRPGPTFRAWDNVRFPQREVDVEAAVAALNLRATRPDEFVCELRPIAGRDGAFVSVDSEFFRVEHLMPESARPIAVPASPPHTLHCLAGNIAVVADDGRVLGKLAQGESALVPIAVGGYLLEARRRADVVRVTLPVN